MMGRESYRDVSLEVPGGWHDDSVMRYVGPKSVGIRECPEIFVTIRPLDGQTIDVLAARDLMSLAKVRETLVIEDSRETELGGHRAIEQRVSWERWEEELKPGEEPGDGGPIAVRQFYVEVTGKAYVVTVRTGPDPASRSLPMIDGILETIRFGAGAEKAEGA